ncbi:hypothetical protein ACFOHK_06995 [Falsigemmobacter intermedius]|uniref:Uncharacterized protein n=1 Tax=Falsigemmobacter intermedius TaxID=1553448 RepID=A0A3S3UFT3_9RHOB|nr:hypothetical protein [Falsigemmobacter intermedius]RWY42947.1 hypothetical protein EP867_05535 [Falsigemmobacter intermedius]
MKPHSAVWGFIVLAALMLGVLIGGVWEVPHNERQPHGAFEYWLNRYQTLIAGTVAGGGLMIAYMQLRQGEGQHRRNHYLSFRRELETLHVILKEIPKYTKLRSHRYHEALRPPPLNAGFVGCVVAQCVPAVSQPVSEIDAILRTAHSRISQTDQKMMLGPRRGLEWNEAIDIEFLAAKALNAATLRIAEIEALNPDRALTT